MKILVVDDEQLLVKGIKFNLENEGYQVLTAYDGAAVKRLPGFEAFDVFKHVARVRLGGRLAQPR